MKANDILIKWTGSKRFQAPKLLQFFPESCDVYYEPFVGGASVLYSILEARPFARRYECSDIDENLIALWNIIKNNPNELLSYYSSRWPYDNDKFLDVRAEFNKDKDPMKFFVLLRTSRNGIVRFNKKGHFNGAFHHGRPGARPEIIQSSLKDWNHKLNKHDVQFFQRDYLTISSSDNDFLYLDPPYFSVETESLYSGPIEMQKLFSWMKSQKGRYALSIDGKVDEDLWNKHESISAGFQRLNRIDRVEAKHDLYLKGLT